MLIGLSSTTRINEVFLPLFDSQQFPAVRNKRMVVNVPTVSGGVSGCLKIGSQPSDSHSSQIILSISTLIKSVIELVMLTVPDLQGRRQNISLADMLCTLTASLLCIPNRNAVIENIWPAECEMYKRQKKRNLENVTTCNKKKSQPANIT